MKSGILILLIFAGLAIFMTYPFMLHMHEAAHEAGDSLFNTWTVAWDIKALLKDPLNIFNTNIFYPYEYTLAYSEHLIGIGLLSLPIYVFTQNPLFIHNFMLILSFVLCGWGAYLLTFYLTKDKLSGIVSGIIFSFCPYRFDQAGHLHVLTSQWIPFTLLFLHKMCVNERNGVLKLRYNIGFGFFFFLQFISSGHNGLYLALAVGLFFFYFRKELGIWPWITAGIVILMIMPFYYPYFYLAREFGFKRPLYEFKLYSPQLSSYLAVPETNWLYGKFLSRFCRPEAVMFPGVTALVLAFWRRLPGNRFRKWKIIHPVFNRIVNVFLVIDLIIILLVVITGGVDLGVSILGIKLKVSDFTRPVYFMIFLIILKIAANWKNSKGIFSNIAKKFKKDKGPVQFYWILAIVVFLLSFGPAIKFMDKDVIWGPYSVLYNFFPGFKGIRVSGRIYTLLILSISILAGFGLKRIRLGLKKHKYIMAGIPLLIIAEYINLPFPVECWIGTMPSSAYRWIAQKPDDSVIIELPMPVWHNDFAHEILYVYWSLYHNKNIVNGYSGYSPPSYWPIAEKMKDFPDDDSVEILKYLGVRFIIVHEDALRLWWYPSVLEKTDKSRTFSKSPPDFIVGDKNEDKSLKRDIESHWKVRDKYKNVLNLQFKDGDDYIYELVDRKCEPLIEPKSKPISKEGWTIFTEYNPNDIYNAIDNNVETRWHSGCPKSPGMSIDLDLGKVERISIISMHFGNAVMDYPTGITLAISKDGREWQEVQLKHIYANYVKHLLKYPKDNRMILFFKPKDARYVRLTQTKTHGDFFWSIYELDVYKD